MTTLLANRAICKKIKYQFPDSPEGKLMFGIVQSAIHDLMTANHRRSAILYLTSDIPHAEIAGVNAKWIRDQLRKVGEKLE